MFSFTAVRKIEGSWRLGIITWGSMELISISDFAKKINMDSDDIKTELIRNWEGILFNSDVKFKSQEKATIAIENYLQPLLTAFILAQSNDVNNKEKERA